MSNNASIVFAQKKKKNLTISQLKKKSFNNIIRPSRLLFRIHSPHIIFLFLSISYLLSLSHILFHLLSLSLSSTTEVILLINYRSNSIPLSLLIPSVPLSFSPHSLSPRPSPKKTLRLKLPQIENLHSISPSIPVR